jgi:arginyl-tRNA synthetase
MSAPFINIFSIFEQSLNAILERLVQQGHIPQGLSFDKVTVDPPRDASHGDLAINAAMVLAKSASMNPKALAELIAAELRKEPSVTAVDIAGPGFINLRLDPVIYTKVLKSLLQDTNLYGKGPARLGKVNVEYVSANPTGPMHVGHGRGAVFGDALASLLEFAGFDVTREYYINDAGAQVDVLAQSAFLRYREALGEDIGSIPEGLYPGDYLKPIGALLAQTYGPSLKNQIVQEWLPVVRDAAINAMMDMIREDLAVIDITHDVFFSERSLSHGPVDHIATTLMNLRERDLVYEGRLEPPKGQPVEDWEDREQTLFRATAYGDDVDRPLLKSDGSYTYFASDIAYHSSKFERGFTTMIDVWGADHGGYVKRMQAAVKAATNNQATLDVKLCQLVKLMRDGEPVKMSKRAGDFVTLRDVVNEVGRDAVRFMMLMRKNDAPLDFDLAKVLEQSKENPVFYVQYAHARCASIFRMAAEAHQGLDMSLLNIQTAPVDILSDSSEREILQRLAHYPRLIEQAAFAHEPHRIAFFLYELAGLFHALWNKGKELPQLRFVNQDNSQSTLARLALVAGVRSVIASGLGILGVSAPEEMR